MTVTAIPKAEEDIKLLPRNPVVTKSSVNRPYITLNVEEIILEKSAELGGMVARQQQQFCTGYQIFLMQMHEF